MQTFRLLLLASAGLSVIPAFANVVVVTPQSGETVGATTRFVANANTITCNKGIAAIGIYVDDKLAYTVQWTKLDTQLTLAPGRHKTTVQSWDFCGGYSKANVHLNVSSESGVHVSLPVNGSTVSKLTSFVATATTTCTAGVSAMSIYVNNNLVYTVAGGTLNTQVILPTGSSQTSVQTSDRCGGSSTTTVNVTVPGGNTLSNLQNSPAWKQSGQVAPYYNDCDYSCPGLTFSMQQGISSPSLSGSATQWNLGGTKPYSDVLFYNQLIGTASTQGLPDRNRQIIPALHSFTYDADFLYQDGPGTQALEFDINMFPGGGVGMTWGTECRIGGGNEWDIWDNANYHWIPTGIACLPNVNQWNHVTVAARRTDDNQLIYESITLNGVTSNLNKTYPPFPVPADWYGVTVNYQMDGNIKQKSIVSYVDNFNFTYW